MAEAAETKEASVVIEDPTETVVADAPADDGSEAEARSSGWVPKDKWKGPPERWRPAKEFLEVRDTVLPVVQKENKALKKQLEEAARDIAELKRIQAENADKRQKLDHEALKYERERALENGDHKRVNEIDSALIDAAVAAKTKPAAPAQQIDPEVQQTWNDFAADNEWTKNPKMQRVLFAQLKAMRESGTDIQGREMLEEAKDFLKRLYPEEIGGAKPDPDAEPRRRPSAMAESGGSNGASRSRTYTWADLKPEAKQALEPMMAEYGLTKEGVLKRCAENPQQYFRSR